MLRLVFAFILALAISGPACAQRNLLTSDLDLYIAPASASPAGDDSNGCVPAAPCLTLDSVLTKLYQSIDAGCRKVTIHLAPTPSAADFYSGASIRGALPGQCADSDLKIVGNTGNPLLTTIQSTVGVYSGGRMHVEGVRITTSSGPGFTVDDSGSRLDIGYIDFGATVGPQFSVGVFSRGKIINHSTVSGGATSFITSPIGQVQIMPGVIITYRTSVSARVTYSAATVYVTEGGTANISYGSTIFRNEIGYPCSTVTICANGTRIAANFISRIYTGANGDQSWIPGTVDGAVGSQNVFN